VEEARRDAKQIRQEAMKADADRRKAADQQLLDAKKTADDQIYDAKRKAAAEAEKIQTKASDEADKIMSKAADERTKAEGATKQLKFATTALQRATFTRRWKVFDSGERLCLNCDR